MNTITHPDLIEIARSSKAEVRNPILGLPEFGEARELLKTQPEFHVAFLNLLSGLRRLCIEKADICHKKRKYILYAYWKVTSVYVGHIARALR